MLSVADAPSVRQVRVRQRKVKRKRPPKNLNVTKIVGFVHKITPRYCDIGLLLPVLGLIIFGIFMVYAASNYNAQVYYDDPFYYTVKQLIGFVLGIVGLSLMYFVDYHWLQRLAYVIFGVAVALLVAVFIPGISISKLGATRWIGIGSFSLQPSEIAKFALVIFAARVFVGKFNANTQNANITRLATPKWWQTLLVLAAGGVMCGLIILEPNMSITMTVGIIMFTMLFLCGVRLKTLGLILLPAVAAVGVMLIAEPYRLKRLSAFIDPWSNPKGEGFQLIESLYAIANGGFWGVGYGNSVQKNMFLPFSESDFIFAIIAEEFGFVGCLALFFVFAWIVYRVFKIGRQCPDAFGRYLCYGIATVIMVQTSLNFAVATGSIPPTGLPLPFISFGGTSLLVFMMSIGIVLNVDKQNKKMLK
ncbi:MAG: putative lipid II flippase FtsW [Prevotella sp.]|nr:putative lipid II flippase FtsW [Prevotella sp.]